MDYSCQAPHDIELECPGSDSSTPWFGLTFILFVLYSTSERLRLVGG